MSKKRDPIVSVLNFFELSDLATAQLGLSLAKEIVRRRLPKVTPAKKKPQPPPRPVPVEPAAAS